jgi:16S rRNA (cytosine1402-N4)-methyltransferase
MSNESALLKHKPVLVQEVLTYLDPQPGGTYLDVTFGSGGHTRAILEAASTCRVIAMDWDTRALEVYGEPLTAEFGERFIPLWGNFAHLYKVVKEHHITNISGILADFGTSQIQIISREGFSIYRDTPLDMRMSPSHQKVTAAQVVNKSSALKLQEIFSQLGGERHAKKIAEAIELERLKKPITTTKQLAALIEKLVGKGKYRIHPATRVFQALRIYVNHELENIEAFLPIAVKILAPHGRLVCISFHELEDRIVKQLFKEYAANDSIKILTKRVITASEQEIKNNNSARSALLRAAMKCA